MKTKTKHKTHLELKVICDKLWADCVKKKAGYKSEISGREGKQIGGEYVMNAHHLLGKPNLHMRYLIENGICITKGEHNFNAHGDWNSQSRFMNQVMELRGLDTYENLTKQKHLNITVDLSMIEIYLRQELANLTS